MYAALFISLFAFASHASAQVEPQDDAIQVSAPPIVYQKPQPTVDTTIYEQTPSIGDFVTAPENAQAPSEPDVVDTAAMRQQAQEEAAKKFAESPEQIVNTVIMQGLNKVNGHISRIETRIAGSVHFENLEITPVRCWKAPPEERVENAVLLEIREIKKKAEPQKIFLGWMFSSSPGLSGLEHPLYDIRVLSCEYRVNIPEPKVEEDSAAKTATPTAALSKTATASSAKTTEKAKPAKEIKQKKTAPKPQ